MNQIFPISITGIFLTALSPFAAVWKLKVKCPVTCPVVAQRLGRGIALLLHDRGTRRG